MHVLGFKRFHLALILALLAFLPLGVEGQLRTVVSNEIAVSEDEAMLRLGFQDQLLQVAPRQLRSNLIWARRRNFKFFYLFNCV